MHHLKAFQIPIRPEDIRPSGPVPYGKIRRKRGVLDCKKQNQIIEKIEKLRSESLSYPKIAQVLNTMNIPTQTGKGKWHANTVYEILLRRNNGISDKKRSENKER